MADVRVESQEAELILRCQQGDVTAFDLLIAAHASRVYNVAYRMLGCQQDAEDAAQEAFLRAFGSIGKFRRGSTFATWLYRITTNVCLDELKRRPNRPQAFAGLVGDADATGDFEDLLLSDASRQDPAQLIEQHACQQEVEQALATLPDHQRAVVVMCDVEGLSYEETATVLATEVGTVKSRLHRARQRLRQLLAPGREQLEQK